MSASTPIQLALQLARDRRDLAAQGVAGALRAHAQAQDQQRQLVAYRQEKESAWITRAQASGGPEVMRHHYAFLDRLDQAIAFQNDAIAMRQRELDQARAHLVDTERRVLTLETLLTTREQARQRVLQRREQRLTDELAQMQHRRRQASAIGAEGSL